MSTLRLLALSYLASASVFVATATVITHPELMRRFAASAAAVAERLRGVPDRGPVVRLELAPLTPSEMRIMAEARPAAPPPKSNQVVARDDRFRAPEVAASAIIPILPDLSPESAPVPSEPKLVAPDPIRPPDIRPDVKVASAAPPAVLAPRIPPAHDRVTAATLRLKDRLTPEMVRHFGLILYVSKARNGPLAQRMVVIENRKGALKPIHDWAVSTGRERDEISPRGRKSFTSTPKGFYEFDPDRMYRRYHSWSWDQDMPHAMFFNWERRGMMTGLAIHAAIGADIAKLGSRASAGCIHLAPKHAALLYRLVRQDYEGRVPRFAYNASTETMSNRGNFMHDRKGRVRMTDGYEVLVMVDDYGGEGRLADFD